MSFPTGKTLTNYGTQVAKGIYARKLYNDETDGLTITTDASAGKHIDILSGSVTLGKLTATKNVMIQEGTLTTQYVSSKSLTDTVASLTGGTMSGLLFEQTAISSVTKILFGTSITDNVATLRAGSITELAYTSSTTITDGTTLIFSGSITGVSRMGINTSGPDRRLDILDNTNPQLRLTHTDGSKGTDLQSDTNSLLTISPVGASTADAVKINSNHATSRLLMVGSSGDNLDIGIHSGSTGNAFFWNKNNAPIEFGTSNTEQMRISASGDVGIATNNPEDKLHIGGANTGLLFKGTWGSGNYHRVMGYNSGKRLEFHYDNGTSLHDNTQITLNTNSSERLRITSAGNIGIGVTDPDTKLEILTTSTQQKWSYDGSNYATMAVASTGASTLANSGGDFTIDAVGDIVLDADGDEISFKFGGATGQLDFSNTNSGDMVIQSKIDSRDLVFKQYDGTETFRLTDAGHAEVKDNLLLKSDAAVLNFGADSDVSLTHVADTGLLLNAAMQLRFRDADIHISSDADGYLSAQADTGVNLNIGGTDLVTVASTNVNVTATTDSSSVSTGGLTVAGGLGVAKMVTGGSFTDGVGTLTAGSLTGLRALTGNRIMLGTVTDISNTNFQSADKEYSVNIDSSKGILFFDSDNTDGSTGYTQELIKSIHYDSSTSTNPKNYQVGMRVVENRDLHLYTNNIDGFGTDSSGGDMVFNTNNTLRFKLWAGGNAYFNTNLGIGVSDPDTQLEVLSTSTQQKWSYDGSNYATMAVASTGASTLANSGGNFTIDAVGDIVLDADGDEISFKFGGATGQLDFSNTNSGDMVIQSKIDSKDLVFKQYDGTETFRLTDAGHAEVKDNLLLKSDAAVLNFGADSDVSLTHVADTGLLLNAGRQLQFRDSAVHISSDADGYLSAQADTGVNLNIGGTDLVTVASTNVNVTATTNSTSVSTGGLTVAGGLGVAKMVSGGSFTDGTATLTSGTITGALSIKSNILTDGSASLSGGHLTLFKNYNHVDTSTYSYGNLDAPIEINDSSSVNQWKFFNYSNGDLGLISSDHNVNISSSSFAGLKFQSTGITSKGVTTVDTLTDGVATLNSGTLTFSGDAGFIEANIGSFTNLYANDLFVADDMVINGTTTYVNTSQTAFEDELISLGATDGRSVVSVSGAVVTCETDAGSSYDSGSYAVCMQSDGTKEIIATSSQSGKEITLGSSPNANTVFIAIIGTETVAGGAGFEILAHNGSGEKRHKTFHYVHNGTHPSMEVKSDNAALDLRISNSSDDSYFSVFDNSIHKQLLTSDALFINTSDGTITNGSDKAAIYLSRNGPKSSSSNSDENGDWRIRVNGTGASQELSFEQYDGSNWNMQWQLV